MMIPLPVVTGKLCTGIAYQVSPTDSTFVLMHYHDNTKTVMVTDDFDWYIQVVVHRRKCVVRFGFVHLMATNIAMWMCTAVSEIQTDYTVNRQQLTAFPTTTGLEVYAHSS